MIVSLVSTVIVFVGMSHRGRAMGARGEGLTHTLTHTLDAAPIIVAASELAAWAALLNSAACGALSAAVAKS